MNKLLSTHYKHLFVLSLIKLSEQFKTPVRSLNTALKLDANYAALRATIIVCTGWSAFGRV